MSHKIAYISDIGDSVIGKYYVEWPVCHKDEVE